MKTKVIGFNKNLWMFLLGFVLILASCKKKTVNPDAPILDKDSQTLSCDFFNEDQVLINKPDEEIDYIIDCHVRLRNTTLTIEPGTVISFTEKGFIDVEDRDNRAAIIAKGTEEEPIIFKGTKEEKGHWRGIRISNENDVNEFDYVIIRDAGRVAWTGGATQGGLSLGSHGGGGQVKVTNSQFINNASYGIDMHISNKEESVPQLILNNLFIDNDFPIYTSVFKLQALDTSNHFIGNQTDEIHVKATYGPSDATIIDATWYNHKIPYVFTTTYVAINSKITIEAGSVLKFPVNGKFFVSNSDFGGTGGGLIAKGTPESPIVFTGIESVPEYWYGINLTTSYQENEISHAIIEGTGKFMGEDTHNVRLNTGNPSNYMKFHNIEFRKITAQECAIWLRNAGEYGDSYADISNITVEEGFCELRDDNVD